MYICGKINVKPQIPDSISRLEELANNLWWSWNRDALKLFKSIDSELWSNSNYNPVKLLYNINQKKLVECSTDSEFLENYKKILKSFDSYMNPSKTWFSTTYPDKVDNVIAYFSAEYGLDEILPIYSGGLGILSGDHSKTASDLGLPFVGVGLFYRQGYFNQFINAQGNQETVITTNNINDLPVKPALNKKGEQVIISVDLPSRSVYAKVWQINVGRIKLYMLDTFLDSNNDSDKLLTARLYGGDQEMRIVQEILLGIGGVKALDALGIAPTIYHMNEGHSSFVPIELIRKLVQEKGISFSVAKEVVMGSCIFTTHTPVPAGHDVFPPPYMDKYFSNYYGYLGISREEFLSLGMANGYNDHALFNMTMLGLHLSGKRNGVSELHGAVSRNMHSALWPTVPEDEVPIGYVTNGVHTLTWLSNELQVLFDKYFPKNWKEKVYDQNIWDKVLDIPDDELWKVHLNQKERLLSNLRQRLIEQKSRHGMSQEQVKQYESYFNPNALTIGFARRFATYKRANLIFRDLDRLARIVNSSDKPVQIFFAGKAHPADKPGQDLIKQIYEFTANDDRFKGKIAFIENYNMTIARYLVHGADIWLNNPRRPLEASGTSGQKASVNGVINFSALDGWWVEGYNTKNGWAIGEDAYYENYEQQDNFDAESLYSTLESQIAPLYYNRNDKGIPVKWIKVMKESIRSTGKQFSSARMLQEYTNYSYVPLIDKTIQIINSNYELAKFYVDWKQYINSNWHQISLSPITSTNTVDLNFNHPINVSVKVHLGTVDPINVLVEVCYGKTDANDRIDNPSIKEMISFTKEDSENYIYNTDIKFDDSGNYAYTFRVIPKHPYLMNKHDMSLIKWVE